LLRNSLEISSRELMAAYEKLRAEATAKTRALETLQRAQTHQGQRDSLLTAFGMRIQPDILAISVTGRSATFTRSLTQG